MHAVQMTLVITLSSLLVAGGCGQKMGEKTEAKNPQIVAAKQEATAGGGEGYVSRDHLARAPQAADTSHVSAIDETTKTVNPAKAKSPTAQIERKIIYTAYLDVVVKDLDAARKKLDALVTQHKAYVASSEIQGQVGARRSGSWTIRVPVAQSGELREALQNFGYTERNSLASEDVTRQFYSLEIRMKNAEATEKRFRDLLAKTEDTDSIIKVETNIQRVRESIDQMKGQLRYWQAMSTLATIHLTLTENKDYKPESAPTFGDKIASTWSGSIDALTSFGEGTVIFFVAMTPWLPLIALIIAPIWWYARRSRKSRNATTATPG